MEVTGGIQPYHYDWSGPGNFYATTKDISSLYPGDYKVVVTDAFCGTLEKTFHVGYLHEHLFFIKDFQNPVNSSTCSGSINIEPYESVWPYTYAWNNGTTTQDLQSLCAGTYTVTITRGSGCTDVLTVVLVACPSPAKPIEVTNVDIKHAIPPNNNKGSIDITLKGPPTGSGPPPTRSFSWTGPNGFTSPLEDITNLAVGVYQLTVNDGCNTLLISYTVLDCNSNYTIQLTAITRPDNTQNIPSHKGSIDLTATVGIPPYTYAWDKTGIGNIPNPTELPSGDYCVTVTDYCGKTATRCERVAICRHWDIEGDNGCTNDPIITVGSWPNATWCNDKINEAPIGTIGNSPTKCDRTLHVTWPNGTESDVVLNENALKEPGSCPVDNKFPYNNPSREMQNQQGNTLAIKIVDACGCESNKWTFFGGPPKPAVGLLNTPLQELIPLYPFSDVAITHCFQCDICNGDAQVPSPANMSPIWCNGGNFSKTLLGYTNPDIAHPCKGGTITCPASNSTFPVYQYISGDLIVNFDEEPTYNALTQTCVYKVGCLFPPGSILGIDEPVFVTNPIGYQVPYQEGLCKKPTNPSNCEGQIISDINGVDSDCNIEISCLTSTGLVPIGEMFMGVVCICGDKLVRSCPLLSTTIGPCKSVGNPLYTGAIFINTPANGPADPYADGFKTFLDNYLPTNGLPSDFKFPFCPTAFTGGNDDRNSPVYQNFNSTLIDLKIVAYPNPTKGDVALQFSSEALVLKLRIMDRLGISVGESTYREPIIANFIRVPLDGFHLVPGIYFLEVEFADGQRKQVKMVKE